MYKCSPGEAFSVHCYPNKAPFWHYSLDFTDAFKLRPLLEMAGGEMYVKVIIKPYPKYPQLNQVNVLDYDSDEIFEIEQLQKGFCTFKASNYKILGEMYQYLAKYPEYTYRIVNKYPW